MTGHRAVPAPRTPASTQEQHPWKAVLRTFVAAAVGVAVAWLVRALGVDLTALSQPIIDSLTGAAWAVGTGVVQWLLTRPGLQPGLGAIGLGTGVHAETRALTAQERSDALTESMDLSGDAEDAFAADHPGREGSELWDQDDETIARYEARAGDS